MGESKNRRLSIVQKQLNNEPVLITLGRKSASRLSELAAMRAGAAQAAQSAVAVANGLDAKWREAVQVELDARDVVTPDEWTANHDTVKGTITLSPPKKQEPPEPTPDQ